MINLDEAITVVEIGDTERGLQLIAEMEQHISDDEKFQLADKYYQWGLMDKAKNVLQTLLDKYPQEGELLIFLAEIHIELDEEEQAIEILNEIVESDEVYVQSLLLLADLYQMQGLDEVSEQKLLQAKRLLPDEPIIDFALGELYLNKGEYKKSVTYYQFALAYTSEIGGTNIAQRLGESLSASGEFEKALSYYEQALKGSEEPNTLFGFGFTAYQAKEFKKAIEIFKKLLKLDEEYSSVYLYLAKSLEQEEQREEAFQLVQKGLKIDPFQKELFFYGGKLAVKLGLNDEAVSLLREAIALDPGYTEASMFLAKLFINAEDFENVEDLIQEIMNYGEHDPQFDWDLARAKNKLEKYSDALNHYRLAYTAFKDNVDFLEEFGFFLLEEGQREEAIELFKKVQRINPTNVEIQQLLFDLEGH